MNGKQTVNNYEKWCGEWREKFLKMDRETLKRRLPELQEVGNHLEISHFGRRYGIGKDTGEIFSLDSRETVPHQIRLNIYTLFGYAKEGACLTGNWVPFSGLEHARPFVPAFQRGIVEPFARTFAGHKRELLEAYEKIGGERLSFSDAGGQIYGFSCIPMRCFFWDRDEEFDASANLLFDESATDFIHVESVVTVAGEGIQRLIEAAGITKDNGLFPRM